MGFFIFLLLSFKFSLRKFGKFLENGKMRENNKKTNKNVCRLSFF